MIINRNRESIAITNKTDNSRRAFTSQVHHLFKPTSFILTACMLFLILFIAAPSLGIAAEETSTLTGKQVDIKLKSEPNGKYLIPDYNDPGKPKEQQSFFSQFLDTIINIVKYVFYFALVLVIGFLAIYGTKLATTKYSSLTGGDQGPLNILEIKYLAPGKAICLVEIAGKVLVLGLAGNNITSLSEFVEAEKVKELKEAAAQKIQPLQPFQAYLERFTKRFSSPPAKHQKKTLAKNFNARMDNDTHWRDNLRSAGDNINKLLKEIKEQEKKGKDPDTPFNHDRGEGER